MNLFAAAEVYHRVKSVAIETQPRVAVVEYTRPAVGESLCTSSIVLSVGLVP